MKVYVKVIVGVYAGACLLAAYHGLMESLFSTRDLYRARTLAHSSNVENSLFLLPSGSPEGISSKGIVVETKVNGDDLEFRQETLTLAMIAFGNATKGNHVHRVIRSARTRGEWNGKIVIITDSKDAFTGLTENDPRVFVLHPRQRDWEGLPNFQHDKMKIKRFKTLLLDYILEDPRLEETEFVLYLDIDIVLCQPLVPWLRQKWEKGTRSRQAAFADGMSSMYMFSEGKNKGLAGHSGVILLHRDLSRGCLLKWRQLFDR